MLGCADFFKVLSIVSIVWFYFYFSVFLSIFCFCEGIVILNLKTLESGKIYLRTFFSCIYYNFDESLKNAYLKSYTILTSL